MIDDAVRRGILALPAPAGRVAVFATQLDPYRAVLDGRDDVALCALDGATVPPGCTVALVEGIDEVEDPLAALCAIAAAPEVARVILLVANAAFAPALDAFVAGETLAGGHAFVECELAPLLAAAGFVTESIAPVYGGAPGTPALPTDLSTGRVKFRVETAAALARLYVAAYVASGRKP